MSGRVNNINYIFPPGDEGTVIEDQTLSAQSIIDAVKTDFNNTSINKVIFVVTDEVDEPAIVGETTPVESVESVETDE